MMDGFGEVGGASALIGTGRTSDLGTTTLGCACRRIRRTPSPDLERHDRMATRVR